MNKIGEELFPEYLMVQKADMLAQSDYKREEKLERIEKLTFLYREILEKKECISLKTLAVTGSDLIDAGMKPGKEIGAVLNSLLEMVLEEPELNKKETLLNLINK